MGRSPWGRALYLLALVTGFPALAEEPSVAALASTIRWAPQSAAARIGLVRLAERGPDGWGVLKKLVVEYAGEERDVAFAAARTLVAGDAPERILVMREAYARVKDEELRALLARGIAAGYPDHDHLIHKRLRKNLPGAADLLAALGKRDLPRAELEACLNSDGLDRQAYAWLRWREKLPRYELLAPMVRRLARRGVQARGCAEFASRFAGDPDFHLLSALVEVLREEDAEAAFGAHGLLRTVSGKRLGPTALEWRSWIAAKRDGYAPPPPGSDGVAAAAVARAARFLHQDLLADGRCLWLGDRDAHNVLGSTALGVLALRAAGVPADDPAIARAVQETLLLLGTDGGMGLPPVPHGRIVYGYALLAMALQALGPEKYRDPLQALADRLCDGQLPNGQWRYELPAPGQPRIPSGDNSCTQYAILGLRAAARAGVEVRRETWERAERFFRGSVNGAGGWGYHATGPSAGIRPVSMTTAGLGSLAICVEALHRKDAFARLRADPVVRRALRHLGATLYAEGFARQELYAWYGLERACILTGTRLFKDKEREFDWYRRGVARLAATQAPDGSWGSPRARSDVNGSGYGRMIDTAYGILFLSRATATIAKSENEGVVAVSFPPDPKPKPRPVAPAVEKKPPVETGPRLRLDRETILTQPGSVEVRGSLKTKGATLTVDGEATALDEAGRFAVLFQVSETRVVEVVATAPDGKEKRVRVAIRVDTTPPKIELVGATSRRVGKQLIEFRASEPLAYIQLAGRVYPVEGRRARAVIELREGTRALKVKAFDLAGNEGGAGFNLMATNKVLLLDGKSAVRVDLRQRPAHRFTMECWVRGAKPSGSMAVFGDSEHSGCTLVWHEKSRPLPAAWVRTGPHWQVIQSKRAWKWSTWTHLAVTYDGEAARFWVNGRLQGSARGGPFTPSHKAFYAGAQPDAHNNPWRPFRGAVDEMRISDVARYTKSFRPERFFLRDKHTVLLLHFDTDTEKNFLDDSGKHNHGRPHGQPRVVAERR